MKPTFLFLFLCLIVFPIFAQEHILVDCIHGANYAVSFEGPVAIDFQAVFPNDILTIVNPDSLRDLTILEDQDILAGQYTFLFNLPSVTIPEEIQTLYVIVHDDSGVILNGITGTITGPDSILTETLFNGSGHIDAAYGSGWEVRVQTSSNAHIFVGYGSTVFSGPGHSGHYNLENYDAILRICDSSYLAFLTETPDYSVSDLGAISNGFTNGLSFMNIFNLMNIMVDKPFIHMYTNENLSASVNVSLPGKRTMALPKPEGDEKDFGWNQIQLKPNSQNEHVYEGALNQKLNFLHFNVSGSSIEFYNQIDVPLQDLILIKSINPTHYEIGTSPVVFPRVNDRIKQWKTYSTCEARDFLLAELFNQCIKSGFTQQEARHFSSELPWVDVLLLRAVKHPDQYFGLYRFDNDIYDKLIPVDITPLPSAVERNMWVMVSNIQPSDYEQASPLNNDITRYSQQNGRENFLYREYGMVDERYSMQNSTRETGFFEIDVFNQDVFHGELAFFNNPFSNALAGYAPSLVFPYSLTSFSVDYPGHYGILYDAFDEAHPYAVAKPILTQGRVFVLGTSAQFINATQFPFLDAAMDSLIHSPNLITENAPEPVIMTKQVSLNNYPNPFNPETTIQFSIPVKGKVKIDLYNIRGQLIKSLLSANMEEGMHSISWKGLNQNQEPVASQVILCRMQYQGGNYTKKIVLMK